MFLLRVLAGEQVVSTHHCQGGVTVVGRDVDCDVVLSHAGVSRRHCVIRADKTGEGTGVAPDFTIEDLGSTNGVVVNGRSHPKRRLMHGDVIELGTARLEFSTHLAMPTGNEEPVSAEVKRPRARAERAKRAKTAKGAKPGKRAKGGAVVAAAGSKVFHRPDCPAISSAAKGGKLERFADSRRARSSGRRPCRRCLA